MAYSGTGAALWTKSYSGPGNNDDRAKGVAVDGNGTVFVTGQSWNNGSYDFVTLAYSAAGVPLWTNRYNGLANGDDRPQTKSCIAIGPDGGVYVTGASDGNYDTFDFVGAVTYDYVTIKYVVPTSLNYQIVGDQIVLSWTNAAFSLQSAPAAQGDYTTIPSATSPYSTDLSAMERYFRLKGN